LARLSATMEVPARATEEEIREWHSRLQAALERVTKFAEDNVTRVGSVEFPVKAR